MSDEHVVLSALKKADKGDGYIARFYETAGERVEVLMEWPLFGKQIRTVFEPYQIRTFRISEDPEKTVEETDFLE